MNQQPSNDPMSAGPTTYPLQRSANNRYLVDGAGTPFLVVGEAAWSLIAAATSDEAITYLDDRAARSFNTLLVNLLEYRFSPKPPLNRAGEAPFKVPGDLTAPNQAYFDHARWILEQAAARGLLVLLTPSYLGFAHAGWPGQQIEAEGWYAEVARTGFAGCRAYGRYLGEQFGDLDNIVWVMGGDRDPGDVLIEVGEMARGIQEADPRHLFTAHCAPESVPVDKYRGEAWLTVNNTYTYGIVHANVYADYIRTPTRPTFLIESTYENEHSASEVQIRRQAYWSVLRGGFGHVFGSTPVWWFAGNWQDGLESPGARGMTNFAAAFRDRRWWDLVPEPAEGVVWNPSWQGRRLVVGGLGESRGLDFCAGARTTDSRLAMLYLPTPRQLTLDLSLISGERASVEWWDPMGGRVARVDAVPARPDTVIDPPGNQDWLVSIEAVDG